MARKTEKLLGQLNIFKLMSYELTCKEINFFLLTLTKTQKTCLD